MPLPRHAPPPVHAASPTEPSGAPPRPPQAGARLRRALLVGSAVAVSAGALVACAPTRALNALAAVQGQRSLADAAYGPWQRQRFDLYTPHGAAPAGGWPLVVFFYGGSWRSGERADYRFVGEALASRGMLVMVADYRLYPEVRYPDFLDDCAAALAHGLAQVAAWGGNPQRVFVMGHSAGAYNAAMLALDGRWLAGQGAAPSALAGWIGLAGPYDFLPIRTTAVQPVFHHPRVPEDSQPVRHVAGSRLPALLLAAQQDNLVDPVRNTGGLAERLAAQGAPVVTRRYERVDHVTLVGALAWPLRALAPVLDDVAAFVQKPPTRATAAAG
jgi:acetyl esterase/lipase